MTSERQITSRLFATSVIEGRTEYDEKYDKAYAYVSNLTKNVSEKEAQSVLNKAIDDRKAHDDICIGLLIGILSDPSNASRHYHDLTLLSRDSFKAVTDELVMRIIGDKYSRLLDVSRIQLLWLVKEMIKTGVTNVEGIVWCLLRQIAGGDISTKNIWLAETLLDILLEHRPWLDKYSVIVASVAYTYLRILEDHFDPKFANLRQKEVVFVIDLLKERFQDCMKIGRDLVRLLQNVAKIPEIEAFWKILLHNPTSIAPNFTGILQLLQMRTSRRFFVVRLTPEMEKKISYLCAEVKFGTQKRYQEWFQRQYLNTPESQTLRCDLIRYIIGVIHPPNEVLCSDIIPRWAVIGWLLSSCTSPVATANSKLSLFYDWLLYNTDTDFIMNIEPGILVMYHSLRPHPVLTTSLLDFLCRIIPNFYPPLMDKVRQGVINSLKQILDKRVVPSLELLFDNSRMDMELRKLVRETFPEFCTNLVIMNDLKPEEFVPPISPSSPVIKMDLMAETGLDFNSSPMSSLVSGDIVEANNTNHTTEDDAMFSDEEEEIPTKPPSSYPLPTTGSVKIKTESAVNNNMSNSNVTRKTNKLSPSDSVNISSGLSDRECKSVTMRTMKEVLNSAERAELSEHMEHLEKDTRSYLEDFLLHKDVPSRCNTIQKVCDLIFSEDLDVEEAQHLAICLSHLLSTDFNNEDSLLPSEVTAESIDESLNKPVFVLFDNLTTLTEDDHRKQSLLLLLTELHKVAPSLGYFFLYFLKASIRREKEDQDDRSASFHIYRDLCKASNQKDFGGFIQKDMQICCERDPRLISWVIPDIYQTFPKQTVGNIDLLQMILERLDSSQLHDLVCMVLQGSLQMFDNNSFANILEKSLQWETIEQMFLWQLARAHEIPVDCYLSVLPKLKFSSHTDNVVSTHGEALSNILMMLRRESPSENLLRHLLLRELRPSDPTVATILQYWVQRYEDKMAKLINDIINTKHQPSPNKRKRNQGFKSNNSVPLDQVLSHLNHLRTACDQTKFFALDTMQNALQTAQNQCSESQKRKYNDLFALIEEDDEVHVQPEPQRKAKSNRGRKPKARKKQESETEEESSEEEDIKKPSRKRKKNHQLGSDSD